MRYGHDDLLDLIRMEAADVVAERQFDGTLVATSYDPDRHMVKGMIMPHKVESGWVRIGASHTGNGFGIVAGPNIGSADKLDGDQFSLHYEGGDANNLVATHKHFSQQDKPPRVESGEIMLKHQGGGSTFFAKDKSITTTHANGGVHRFDPEGHHTLDTKGKNVTINSGTGSQTFAAKSQSFTADNIAIKGKVALDGDLSSTGKLNGGGGVLSSNLPVRTA